MFLSHVAILSLVSDEGARLDYNEDVQNSYDFGNDNVTSLMLMSTFFFILTFLFCGA